MPESTEQIQQDNAELETRMVELAEELRETAAKLRQAISDEGAQVTDRSEEIGLSRRVPSAAELEQASEVGDSEIEEVVGEVEKNGDVAGAEEPAARETEDSDVMEEEHAPIGADFSESLEREDDWAVEETGENGEASHSEELAERRFSELRDPDAEQIRSLDDELAQLADDLVAGDISDGLEGLVEAVSDVEPEPSADRPADVATASVHDDALRELEEIASASDGVEREIESRRRGDTGAAGPLDASVPLARLARVGETCVRLGRKYGPIIAAEVRPLVRKMCEILSQPLDGRPPIVRQSVGIFGVVTLVYALVVLFYVIAIRAPYQEQAPPTDVVLRADDGRAVASRD